MIIAFKDLPFGDLMNSILYQIESDINKDGTDTKHYYSSYNHGHIAVDFGDMFKSASMVYYRQICSRGFVSYVDRYEIEYCDGLGFCCYLHKKGYKKPEDISIMYWMVKQLYKDFKRKK